MGTAVPAIAEQMWLVQPVAEDHLSHSQIIEFRTQEGIYGDGLEWAVPQPGVRYGKCPEGQRLARVLIRLNNEWETLRIVQVRKFGTLVLEILRPGCRL